MNSMKSMLALVLPVPGGSRSGQYGGQNALAQLSVLVFKVGGNEIMPLTVKRWVSTLKSRGAQLPPF
eukprot:10004822-Karenia_brevis.AAC.1